MHNKAERSLFMELFCLEDWSGSHFKRFSTHQNLILHPYIYTFLYFLYFTLLGIFQNIKKAEKTAHIDYALHNYSGTHLYSFANTCIWFSALLTFSFCTSFKVNHIYQLARILMNLTLA